MGAEQEPHTPEAIHIAAQMLGSRTREIGVSKVDEDGRNKVQEAYRQLMEEEIFKRSIQSSRPQVEECHLVFTPHLPSDSCLAWWVFPYSHNWDNQPEGLLEVIGEPCFGLDPHTGGIALYWDEDGEYILCGYD